MKWIVVQTAFLGDVVLTLPLCVAIKQYDPDAEVVFVTTPAASGLIQRCSSVDKVVVFDKRARHRTSSARNTLARNLHASDATVLVPHKSFRTMMFVRDMRAQRVVTYADAWTRWIADVKVPYPARLHDAQRHLALLTAVSNTAHEVMSMLPIPLTSEHDRAQSHYHVPPGTNPLVVLSPGSVWPTKQWPMASLTTAAPANRTVRVIRSPGPPLAGSQLQRDRAFCAWALRPSSSLACRMRMRTIAGKELDRRL